MLNNRGALYALGALFVILVLALVVYPRGERRTSTPPSQTGGPSETSVAITPVSATPSGDPVMPMMPTTPNVDGAASAAGDADPDAFDRFAAREAIEQALESKDVGALPAIERTDLTRDGYVAASAIDAVGKLAAIAPEPAKKQAVETLGRWLEQESKRKTPDATGNVSILVESLADTKSKDAIAPLVAALDAGTYPLEVQTTIVTSLDALDARSESASVERFVARVEKMAPADDLQRELAKEAVAAAKALLAKWHGAP
jgi:hypothetical protein